MHSSDPSTLQRFGKNFILRQIKSALIFWTYKGVALNFWLLSSPDKINNQSIHLIYNMSGCANAGAREKQFWQPQCFSYCYSTIYRKVALLPNIKKCFKFFYFRGEVFPLAKFIIAWKRCPWSTDRCFRPLDSKGSILSGCIFPEP